MDGVRVEGPQRKEGSYIVPNDCGIVVGCDTLLFIRFFKFHITIGKAAEPN